MPATAGGLLRQARQARGLHIAALANSMKVSPQKLEMLETDRFDQLPGTTFTRALAQTVCRTLKIDATPVLALLPHPADRGLEQMSRGLNEPFRDRPGRRVPKDFGVFKNPAVLGALVLVVAAIAIYLMPSGWLPMPSSATHDAAEESVSQPATQPVVIEAVPTTGAASMPELAASGVTMVETVHSVPGEAAAASESASAVPVSGVLQLRTNGESWVEVTDHRGTPLLSRLLQAGETVGIDGAGPLRVRIGNAAATSITYRGQAVDLGPITRDNVVKLELK